MFEVRSALAGVRPASGRDGADGSRRVLLGEMPLGSLLQVGAYPGAAARVAGEVSSVLGGPLPESSAVAAVVGGHQIFRIAPDQYWIRTPDAGLGARLRTHLALDAGSVTPLDGARTCIVIGGPAARALLGRLVAVDVDPTVFRIGCFAQTPIHHVGGLVHRAGADRYEFLALRSFAADIWEVIADAALFFGYDLVGGPS
jgi:sarcosine oxidase subunit gamma